MLSSCFLPQIFTTQVPVLMRENNNGLYGVDAFFLVNKEILIPILLKNKNRLCSKTWDKNKIKKESNLFSPLFTYSSKSRSIFEGNKHTVPSPTQQQQEQQEQLSHFLGLQPRWPPLRRPADLSRDRPHVLPHRTKRIRQSILLPCAHKRTHGTGRDRPG